MCIKKTTMDVISRNMPRFKYTLHKIYTKALNLSNLMVYNFLCALNIWIVKLTIKTVPI